MKTTFDILVIGSGAAGLSFALEVAGSAKVALISKGKLDDGSTRWAQGGIAAVLEKSDTINSHIKDTLEAGVGLCNNETVKYVVKHGKEVVEDLIKTGVSFSKDEAPEEGFGYHLTREGGHSHRRVIHADDATGVAVQTTLEARARDHKNITIFENHLAVDLITNRHLENNILDHDQACYGAYVLNVTSGHVIGISARATILATGGAAKVYLYTSNPDGSTGDGIAMAWRAGCRVANMEFNQFHPTCLYHPDAKSFLISEALRGEGANLTLSNGKRFMDKYHKLAELAPRDIVARAIDSEMKENGIHCVYLDISHKNQDFIISQFPNIYRRCLTFGFDITKEPIPVVPAAHYTCGGVMVDLDGKTDLNSLFAIGEVSHTGLHGANRMASNSLLECLVFGRSSGKKVLEILNKLPSIHTPLKWDESRVTDSDEEVVVSHNWDELRRFMWDYVGIVRTDKRLERAKRRIDMLQAEIHDYYGNFRVTKDLLELRNLVTLAELIVKSAMLRKESRGLHFTTDYPQMLNEAKDTILEPT
ncbi:MAG: L-aspartate oxidase [Sphingomonadales bacterium]